MDWYWGNFSPTAAVAKYVFGDSSADVIKGTDYKGKYNPNGSKPGGFTAKAPVASAVSTPKIQVQSTPTYTADDMGGGGGGYGGGYSAAYAAQAAQDAKDNKERGQLRGDIKSTIAQALAAYDQLFGQLDALGRDRGAQVEKDYGDQFTKAAKQYADSLPGIENSYAAIGAGDSTDNTYAKNTAKTGFEDTNKSIQKNKNDDLAKIGNFIAENKAKYNADKDSLSRLNGRVDQATDLSELRGSRNATEDKLGSIKADQGTLNTDAGARGQLSAITQDAGRADSLSSALDAILQGSMSQSVKDAAVESVAQAGGLSSADVDAIKKRNAAQYGSAYQPAAA